MTKTRLASRGVLAVVVSGALVIGSLATVAVASAPSATKTKVTTFVAEVPGTDAFIGIAVGKDSARAYVCDGEELGEWLDGAVANGTLALESANGSTLVAEVKGKTLRGTLVLADNQVIAIAAKKAKGKAGLFRKDQTIDGVDVRSGWVRLPDGSLRGFSNGPGLGFFGAELSTPPTTRGATGSNPGGATGSNPGGATGSNPITVPPIQPLPPEIAAQVPESPPPNAVVKAVPALDTTVASTSAPPPSPTPPTVFDASECSRINRALSAIVDEIEVLGPDDLRSVVFNGTFGRLRARAIFGGCQGIIDEP